MWPSFLPLSTLPRFGRSMRKGQTIVEYALILAVLTVVFIAAFSLLSQELIRIFSVITTMLDSAQSSTF